MGPPPENFPACWRFSEQEDKARLADVGGPQVRPGAAAAAAAAESDTVDTVAQREGYVAGTGFVAAQRPVALQNFVFVRQLQVDRGA